MKVVLLGSFNLIHLICMDTFTETSKDPAEAVVAGNVGEQGPSAILETEEQRSWREYGGMSSISSKPVLVHGCYHAESNRRINFLLFIVYLYYIAS